MSGIDKLRSFAESKSGDHEIIRDGLTYGDVREVVRELRRDSLQGLLMEAFILYSEDAKGDVVRVGDRMSTLNIAAVDWIQDGAPGMTADARYIATLWRDHKVKP